MIHILVPSAAIFILVSSTHIGGHLTLIDFLLISFSVLTLLGYACIAIYILAKWLILKMLRMLFPVH